MTEHHAVALDVGGVVYYDEPFELAWIHRVLARACETDPSFTVPDLIGDMEIFYAASRQARARTNTVFSRPLARESWLKVRAEWNDLVQPIPGAVDAVRQLAGRYDVCVVANQPPECVDALGRLHLRDTLKLVALDSIVGYAKPDPRLLGWALASLGLRAGQMLVVGNRWDHDIAPAQALGCPTVLICPDDGWSRAARLRPGCRDRVSGDEKLVHQSAACDRCRSRRSEPGRAGNDAHPDPCRTSPRRETGMKIALLNPPFRLPADPSRWISVPPQGYGGIQWVVATLLDGLLAAGCELALLGAPGSPEAPGLTVVDVVNRTSAEEWLADSRVDVVHDHTNGDLLPPQTTLPTLSTFHLTGAPRRRANCVYVSDAQRTGAGSATAPVIRLPVNPQRYLFTDDKQDYLLFLGRVSRHKGVKRPRHSRLPLAYHCGLPVRAGSRTISPR